MTQNDFLSRAALALASDTVYMKGVFGAPVTEELIEAKAAQYPDWYTEKKCAALREKTGFFGFDCVCFVKALLWGWNADNGAKYGGAVYAAGGIPDFSVEGARALCTDLSEDFDFVQPGELLFLPGHVGIYVGGGEAIECTPSFGGGVVRSTVRNLRGTGANPRTWNAHGTLPFVSLPTVRQVSVPVLRKGCKNRSVASLQSLLTSFGFPLDPDASFGAKTDAALRSFQQAAGLTVDGVCGRKTWGALLNP